jgi:hypothetical protein
MQKAETLWATSSPNSTGSRVSPQPPCSLGRATVRSVERCLARGAAARGPAAPEEAADSASEEVGR